MTETVAVPYKSPSERAALTLRKQLAIDAGVMLLVGLLEIVNALPADHDVNWNALALTLGVLLLKTLLATALKYQSALEGR